MATYPAYEILLDSARDEEAGEADEYTPSGLQISRLLHDRRWFRFVLLHDLTLAELLALEAFYDAGKRSEHTLTYFSESPIQTYTVKFTGPPVVTENAGENTFVVQVPLRGYKN